MKFLQKREYTRKNFAISIFFMFLFCFLAFSGAGQYLLILFSRLVAYLFIIYTFYVAVRLSIQEEDLDDFVEESETVEEQDILEDDIIEIVEEDSDDESEINEAEKVKITYVEQSVQEGQHKQSEKKIEQNKRYSQIEKDSSQSDEQHDQKEEDSSQSDEQHDQKEEDSNQGNEQHAKSEEDFKQDNEQYNESEEQFEKGKKEYGGENDFTGKKSGTDVKVVCDQRVIENDSKRKIQPKENLQDNMQIVDISQGKFISQEGKNLYFFGVDGICELIRFIVAKGSDLDFKTLEGKEKELTFCMVEDSAKKIWVALKEHRCYTSKKTIKTLHTLLERKNGAWNKTFTILEKNFEILSDTQRNLRKTNLHYVSGIADEYERYIQSEQVYQNYVLCAMFLQENLKANVFLVTTRKRLSSLAKQNGIEAISPFSNQEDNKLLEDLTYAERVFFLDETALQYLADYFELNGFKYWEILQEENIQKMSPMVATLVSAMKMKLCYTSTDAVNSLMQGKENEKENESTLNFPKKFHYIINRFTIIQKEDVERIRSLSNPSLLDYALYLKRWKKKKVTIFTQYPEIEEAFEKVDSAITIRKI